MGVHCRTLGHAYESTEFEQDREERAEGTVLVCREYRVCSRCGHREELYHNERLIAPATASDSDSQPAANMPTDTPASSEDPSESTADPPSSPAHTASMATSDSEASDTPTADHSPSKLSTESGEGGHRHGNDSNRSSAERSSQRSSSAATDTDSTDPDTETPVVSSSDEGEESSTDPERDDAVILTETAARAADGGSAASRPAENAWRNDQPTAERADMTSDQLVCSGCDATWTRAETPLREGDLCPACHAAYLERQ